MKQDPRIEVLLRENAELKETVANLGQERMNRAEPLALAVMDALDVWCQMVERGHPNGSAARRLISRWLGLQERLRAANSGIQVVGRIDD